MVISDFYMFRKLVEQQGHTGCMWKTKTAWESIDQLYGKIRPCMNWYVIVENLSGKAQLHVHSLLLYNANQQQLCPNFLKNIFDLPETSILRENIIIEIRNITHLRKDNLLEVAWN